MIDSVVAWLTTGIAEASTKEYAFWLAISAIVTSALFLTAFRNWRWTRLIEDIPTSRARSAHQGYVELQGTAELMDGPQILTPISQRECVWWSLVVEKRTGDGWRTTDRETSDELFYLCDETGRCIVDPEGAKVWPPHKRVTITGRSSFTLTGAHAGEHRNTEHFIVPNDHLYVIGMHTTHTGIDNWDNETELLDKLRDWKSDQDRLLHRFDENRDGRIDAREWETARRAARAEVAREHREASVRPGVSVLGAPQDGRPFLIASDHQDLYMRRLRRIALATGIAFVAGAALTITLVATRFSP